MDFRGFYLRNRGILLSKCICILQQDCYFSYGTYIQVGTRELPWAGNADDSGGGQGVRRDSFRVGQLARFASYARVCVCACA